MRLKILLLAVSIVLSCLSMSYAEEKITLSTFYPAPYGEYDELTAIEFAANKAVIGPTYPFPTNDGDLFVEGNVGIGTTALNEKLEVNGGIKMGNSTGTNSGTMRWTGSEYEGYYPGTGWQALGTGGGCYVSYSGACLAGFTMSASLGWWGYCSNFGDPRATHFRPAGGGCSGGGWSGINIGEAFVCCQ